MTALLFGSISTLADTSELQRAAFNAAFVEHGLDWQWDRDEYVELLRSSGGADRIAAYATERGQDVDAAAVHATKSRIFQERLAAEGATPRPGVAEAIRSAAEQSVPVALVTTTETANVTALLAALEPEVRTQQFALIVDTSDVLSPKPDPAAYTYALRQLGQSAADCIAVEDNEGGLQAATQAGITCVAFPNANTRGHAFAGAAERITSVDLASLTRLTGQSTPTTENGSNR